MPFSVIGSTEDVLTLDGRTVKGRQYSWGVAEGRLTVNGWITSLECAKTTVCETDIDHLFYKSLVEN
jgi:hypothetical protein